MRDTGRVFRSTEPSIEQNEYDPIEFHAFIIRRSRKPPVFRRHRLSVVIVGIFMVFAGCSGGAGSANPAQSNATVTAGPASTTMTAGASPTGLTTLPSSNMTTASPPERADVVFDDQHSNGTRLVLTRVVLRKEGFVAITNGTADAAGNRSVLGSSAFLQSGVHTDVTVELDTSLDENRTLTAVIYADTSGDRDPDEDGSDEVVEGPNGSAITDTANVTVISDTATTQEPTAITTCRSNENPVRGPNTTETGDEQR